MCWVALDRAVRLARDHHLGPVPAADVQRWATQREEIRHHLLREGWDDRSRVFTGALGSDRLDASALMVPLVGFLPASDPRVLSTVDAIEEQLSDGGLVYRWTGAESDEGAFAMCSYWLAACRALAGQVDAAVEVFEQVTAHANDLGVLSEMVDPHTGDQLGNVPQALSHASQVCAAWNLDCAAGGPGRGDAGEPSHPARATDLEGVPDLAGRPDLIDRPDVIDCHTHEED
jgi:GH15 family glucan-1,4-alpha-glucosidase